jgi:hypothetical protein
VGGNTSGSNIKSSVVPPPINHPLPPKPTLR